MIKIKHDNKRGFWIVVTEMGVETSLPVTAQELLDLREEIQKVEGFAELEVKELNEEK